MMVPLHPQFVTDGDQQPKAVQVTLDEWEQIISDLEELDDIRTYDKAKTGLQDATSFEQAVRELDEESEA